jgi:hypothetical protein
MCHHLRVHNGLHGQHQIPLLTRFPVDAALSDGSPRNSSQIEELKTISRMENGGHVNGVNKR